MSCYTLSLCLQVSSADTTCKQFGPGPDLDANCLTFYVMVCRPFVKSE